MDLAKKLWACLCGTPKSIQLLRITAEVICMVYLIIMIFVTAFSEASVPLCEAKTK